MMEAKRSVSVVVVILLVAGITECDPRDEDLIAEESSVISKKDPSVRNHKYSSRIESKYQPSTEPEFGLRTVSIRKGKRNETDSPTTEISTRKKSDFRENEINSEENVEKKKDMAAAGSANGKQKKETPKKEEDDEEKTLAQQVADGKYGLIQNEIFANGSKRPGILSYLSNSEVPKDTKENFGGLERDEIWLAEDHVLVLRGGRYPEKKDQDSPSSSVWPPIDDYAAPTRQVKIPENPEIPPPFPVRLRENGPLEFLGGKNGTPEAPPFFPPFPPPFPFRANETLPFPFPVPFPRSPDEASPNGTFPFPFPAPGPVPPFPGNFPPGAAFLPPPGNLSDFDEDDPSIYYPPKYDFYYPRDNATEVPPGPLVPGIILPPPPDFFAPLENENEADEENETDGDLKSSTETPYVGPDYLPVPPRKPPTKHRASKRPSNVAQVYSSPSPPEKQTVTYVYPENVERNKQSPFGSFRTTKIADSGSTNPPEGFSSPIYVPDGGNRYVYHPLPTTSPKPNHITIPTTKALTKEIYIVTTPEAVDNQNRIEDSYQSPKTSKPNKYENLSPEIHPLRSLIRPNVSVSYVGKYGHLPASTPFPYPKRPKPIQDAEGGAVRGGHYITRAPDFSQNVVTTPVAAVGEITVTPVPAVKKIRIRPVVPESSDAVTPPSTPSKATFYFYEEPPATENPGRIVGTSAAPQRETSTEKPQIYVKRPEPEAKPPASYYYSSAAALGKTPIRQFLEETFHSSNVLPNKPQISHLDHAGIIKHGYYSADVPKMKHLNYGGPVPTKPVKYHYVTDEESVTIPQHKIKALEVENSGSSGLQSIEPSKSNLRPFEIRRPSTTTQRPEIPTIASLEPTTSSVFPLDYRNTDPPFIPSNYYATAKPEHLHFTPQDHTLVDDITKNYFTIFGQKINSASTTPLAPVQRPAVTDVLQTYRPHRPIQPDPALKFYKAEKNKFLHVVTTSPRPQSHFEQYLKEITGHDHKEYIVTNVYPTKTKKGKGFLPNDVPPRLHSPESVFLQPLRQIYFRDEAQQQQQQLLQQQQQQQPPPQPQPPQPPIKTRYPYRGFVEKPSFAYGPVFSTTLRPIVDVEIRPQYVEHVSSTSGPFESIRRPPENVRFNHNFGQYLREITSPEPLKIKTSSHFDYFSTTPSPVNQIDYSPTRYPPPEVTPKPPSLEGDILINYKPQRPEINPEAETIDVGNPIPAFASGANFKIVDPPDLSLHRNRVPYRATYDPKSQHGFDATKDFFENLPKSGYFSPSHGSTGNSFISYNLPGNGGHFYFLTPQIVEKFQQEERAETDRYRTVKRNEDRTRGGHVRNGSESRYSSQNQQNTRLHGYSTPDYFRRRRRKKT